MNNYTNRELSWLKFNERVLEEAAEDENPLLEQLQFCAIYESNLDEFFMVRVGSLVDRIKAKGENDDKTNLSCKQQLDLVLEQVRKINPQRDKIFRKNIRRLKEYGAELVDLSRVSKEELAKLEAYYRREIKPLLSPQIVGKRRPFPFLRSGELYAVYSLETKSGGGKIGIIPCGEMIKRLIPLESGRFILSEDVILRFGQEIFGKHKIKSRAVLRIVRNADIDADEAMYDCDIEYREAMGEVIKSRTKLRPVMLEYCGESEAVRNVCEYLDMKESRVFSRKAPMNLSFVYTIRNMLKEKKELFYSEFSPVNSYSEGSMIEKIKEKDILLSYPYESMRPFLRMLREAAEDKNVASIKMTLYRVAKYSKVVEALIDAAENGKEVVVLVELRARFDESNNIEWSRRMEEAGCRVIYGPDGIKVHSKLCLITRKTESGIEYITQIGTGNYNENTARIYTDLSLMTADRQIGEDALEIFNSLSVGGLTEKSKVLLAAPKMLRDEVIRLIDIEGEKGADGYIGIKINALTDKKIMERLIFAAKNGTRVELIVRGICCLLPQSENIRIISNVGRFLEHSRIYIFGKAGAEKVYISSADLMTRNTLRRVEVAAPVLDEDLRRRIRNIFELSFYDTVNARVLNPDGSYTHIIGEPAVNSQEILCMDARKDK